MIMKKILLTFACVFGMSTVASALTSSAVLLQHNGNITTYAAEDIAKAMAATGRSAQQISIPLSNIS